MPSSTSSATPTPPSKVTEHGQPLTSEQEKLAAEAEFRTSDRLGKDAEDVEVVAPATSEPIQGKRRCAFFLPDHLSSVVHACFENLVINVEFISNHLLYSSFYNLSYFSMNFWKCVQS